MVTERVGNQKYYEANAQSPVFTELSGLVRKTVGLAGPLQAALAPLAAGIAAAFIYGSVAKGTDKAASDIDVMIIGDKLQYDAVYSALQGAEAALARTINPNLMTRAEWRRKRRDPDSFASRIAAQPRVFVIGSENDVE